MCITEKSRRLGLKMDALLGKSDTRLGITHRHDNYRIEDSRSHVPSDTNALGLNWYKQRD